MKIPKKGMRKKELFDLLEEYRSDDVNWRSGRVMGYIYDAGREAEAVGKEAYMMFLTENGLDPTIFQSLLRLENDLVSMATSHLNGDADVVGNFTSGGTESIILAVKTARDYFRARKPHIKEPEMILPMTAHAAFYKAAEYLDVRPVRVPVDSKTFRADAGEIAKAIGPNTILLVGSAPSYAHGVIDPIADIAALALEKGLLFHVDACVGGFMLPYFRRLGEPIPDFDFGVPGVTSISMDLHKYAYTPKNASMVFYRTKELRKYQLFACSRWPGYTVVNTAAQSSKSGGPLAAAWAVLHFIGDEGYLEIARHTLAATRKMVAGIEEIEGLRIMARPDMCMFSFTSDTINVFHIIDEMKKHGWYIQPQLECEGSQKNIHISINESNAGLIDEFLSDLRASVEKAQTISSSNFVNDVKQILISNTGEVIGDEDISHLMGMVGVEGNQLPESMADINEILNILPAELRERVLIHFINELFHS
ncbi:MAG: aspartate aminotransferase family protein [Deltaproteobacteria bacterium]|nr:aspartate aminotransferase family protein [Deltaproteobacteria bacterium]